MAASAVLAVLGALTLGAVALGYTATAQASYTSESLVIVLSDSGGSVGPITAAWVEIGGAPTVLNGAAQSLRVDPDPLRAALSVSQPDSTPLVSIRMTTTDPDRSAAWANAVAGQLLSQAARQPIDGFRLDRLTVAVPATQADPDQSGLLLTAALVAGALGGGVLGRRISRRRPARTASAG
jgi:uncharacterized protein involved in exopolysaccharide biosynthesis